MAPRFHRATWPMALLLLALFSCHDAPRTNPFDPALTPAVELQVALDDTAGTATLAVDSQGYIYVADEINKRIQRFAP